MFDSFILKAGRILFVLTSFLLLWQAQGELLVEHMQNTGEVVLASTSPEGQTLIRNEIKALTESFHQQFNGEQLTTRIHLKLFLNTIK